MTDAGLSPGDPARWWLSVITERDRQERDRAAQPAAENDIQVLDP